MKKVLFTLALGLFFVTFSHAQSTVKEIDETKVVVEQTSCEPDCTKDCCADKNADAKLVKNSKSCNDKKTKGCADKKTAKKLVKDGKSCDDKKSSGVKTKSCADKKRPSTCKD